MLARRSTRLQLRILRLCPRDGFVITLFGPPGGSKTLSAEATSEHPRHPLYVVGSELVIIIKEHNT